MSRFPTAPGNNQKLKLSMKKEESAPLALFGIRIKTLITLLLFIAIVLAAVNRNELASLLTSLKNAAQQETDISLEKANKTEENHLIVDQEMLSKAMQEVQVQKVMEFEAGDSTIPTDRFFYVVELVSGGDLEGIELTIEPDAVILVSEGGTETTIERTMVSKIHRFKLPPSAKNEQAPK